MKYIGITNPLPFIVGFAPIYVYYRLVNESTMTINLLSREFSGALIFTIVTMILVIGPIIILMFCKIIAIDNDSIVLIYPFRFRTLKFRIVELRSVYMQLNNQGRISFMETHLYFGNDRRIKFSSLEILNFDGLSSKLKELNKSPSR